MPPYWKVIRAAREDITDWVIHWTRYQSGPSSKYVSLFEVLKLILQCGYLTPTFAPRTPRFAGEIRNTIQGPHPAVCFTDQPLSAFVRSCKALGGRYQFYGIAFEKQNLFAYGGRPVFYGDKYLVDRLRDEDKYLWVRYDPIPAPISFSSNIDYPIDWSHEREWRARTRKYAYLDWGLTPEEGVPLILPPIYIEGNFTIPLPIVLVRSSREAEQLREFLASLSTCPSPNGFIKQLYDQFPALKILPFEIVVKRLEEGDRRWERFETVPWDEVG